MPSVVGYVDVEGSVETDEVDCVPVPDVMVVSVVMELVSVDSKIVVCDVGLVLVFVSAVVDSSDVVSVEVDVDVEGSVETERVDCVSRPVVVVVSVVMELVSVVSEVTVSDVWPVLVIIDNVLDRDEVDSSGVDPVEEYTYVGASVETERVDCVSLPVVVVVSVLMGLVSVVSDVSISDVGLVLIMVETVVDGGEVLSVEEYSDVEASVETDDVGFVSVVVVSVKMELVSVVSEDVTSEV